MVIKKALKNADKIRRIKAVNEAKYKNIPLHYLIMFAVGKLDELHVDLSFENIVVAVYKLFPSKFSLQGYSEYPDSNRIYRRLSLDCISKSKRWLGGRFSHGFIITEKSRRIISEATELLEGKLLPKVLSPSLTRRKETLLAELKFSRAYQKYLSGQKDTINETEICFLLQGTLDTPREILKRNFILMKEYANEMKDTEITKFFNWLITSGKIKAF